MTQSDSYNNSESARLAKVSKQRSKIQDAIKKAEKAAKFEVVYYEEMYIENKTYFESKGYIIRNHGGPQNTYYNTINWSTPS